MVIYGLTYSSRRFRDYFLSFTVHLVRSIYTSTMKHISCEIEGRVSPHPARNRQRSLPGDRRVAAPNARAYYRGGVRSTPLRDSAGAGRRGGVSYPRRGYRRLRWKGRNLMHTENRFTWEGRGRREDAQCWWKEE